MANSYSRMSTHTKCGLKYRFAYVDQIAIDKTGQEMGPALVRGNRLHDSVEGFYLGTCELDPDLVFHAQWLSSMKDLYDCKPELKWGITEDWEACDFDSEDAYIRGIWDLAVFPTTTNQPLDIKEWKSGKIYPEHGDQRYLYSMAALITYPEYPKVKTDTVYFDQKESRFEEWGPERLPSMKAHFTTKIKLMGMEQTWIPNPGFHCKWCDFSKANGGPCAFGG